MLSPESRELYLNVIDWTQMNGHDYQRRTIHIDAVSNLLFNEATLTWHAFEQSSIHLLPDGRVLRFSDQGVSIINTKL